MSIPALVDSHCHLDYIQRQENHPDGPEEIAPDRVLARAAEAGVAWIVNPGVTPARFPAILALAERFENVYAALSVHPTDTQDVANSPGWLDELEALLSHPKVVAIGETGLDYYHDMSQPDQQKARQKTCFRQLLALALKHDLPVIVHDREAHDDVHALVSEFPGIRGIMHCFSGDAAFAEKMIERGFYISFAGNVTFKKAEMLQEAAKAIPLERLLIETDAPFLSPVPFRGKPNEPARVRYVAEKIAELRGIPYAEVAAVTTENAKQVFRIPAC